MNDDNVCKTQGANSFKDTSDFFDLYDFLGIPPASPPNLIYLAITKIENILTNTPKKLAKNDSELAELKKLLNLCRENLFNNVENRVAYEQQWENYYFPCNSFNETDVESSKIRSENSKLLRTGLKHLSSPIPQNQDKPDNFNYQKDFEYLIMRDRPKERDIFSLNTEELIQLPPLEDSIYFEKKQFFLRSHGQAKITIANDALGKSIYLVYKKANIPLHIGDRIEFESGTRLILRGFYIKKYTPTTSNPKWGFYLPQEQILLPLDEEKIYIVGRNTSDIRNLSFNDQHFCFVNVARRERSISRQNFQIFFHGGLWHLQDLGSRYGTTLDFENHSHMETLAGGSIMPLDSGKIRLGYDKSYIVLVDKIDKLKQVQQKEKAQKKKTYPASDGVCVYDLVLL